MQVRPIAITLSGLWLLLLASHHSWRTAKIAENVEKCLGYALSKRQDCQRVSRCMSRNVPIVPNGTERQTTLRKRFVTVGINTE
jgi:hypothetical protein